MENTKCNRAEKPFSASILTAVPGDSRWWFAAFPWLAYCAVIFYFSSLPRWPFRPPEFFASDKLLHLGEFVLLGILTGRVIGIYGLTNTGKRLIFWVTLFGLVYGLVDELHQWFVPGRFASGGDVLADTLGCAAGGWLYTRFRRPQHIPRIARADNAMLPETVQVREVSRGTERF